MRKHEAVFANFICKFGDGDMVDYLAEIVLPAFTRDTRVRFARGSTYHFLDVEIANLGSEIIPQHAIFGRFIKDHVIQREQYLDPQSQTITRDPQSLQSSPSAFFLLLLADHRLIYFAETAFAPNLKAFEATARRFLRDAYQAFVLQQRDDAVAVSGPPPSLAEIRRKHPHPELNVVPIAGNEEVDQFIARFGLIKSLKITVHQRNKETDASEIMESLSFYSKSLKSDTTNVSFSGSENGLDAKSTAQAISEIAKGGNQTVAVSGVDQSGAILKGDNEEFSVSTPIQDPPAGSLELAKVLFEKFSQLVVAGIVSAGQAPQAVRQKIAALIGSNT